MIMKSYPYHALSLTGAFRSLIRRIGPGASIVFSIGFSLMTAFAWGQTNPTAQNLPYSQNFASLTAASTTYPAGWQGWQLGTSATTAFRTNAPTADLALNGSSTAATTTGGVHNYNGKIGILQSGSVDPALALAINTTAQNNIRITYDVMTIRNPYDGTTNTRINEVTLQYRVGTSGTFTSLTGIEYQNNTTNQTGAVTTPQNLVTKTIILPPACNNQAVVQLRWAARDVSGAGARPSFAVDNITACQAPTADAGPDQMTCVDGVVYLPGAVGGSATGGTWTSNTAGGFFLPNANTPAAFYIPPAGNTNPITLVLTTTGGTCPPAATDTAVITYGTLPPLVLTATGPSSATCGENVVISIMATSGFTDIKSYQFVVEWDPLKFQYVTNNATVIGGVAGTIGTFDTPSGQLTYGWVDPAGIAGETLPNGTTVLTVTLKAIASSGMDESVDIVGTIITPIEATNSQQCFLTVTPENNVAIDLNPIAVNCPDNMTVCIDAAAFELSGATPVGGTYSGTGVDAGFFDPATAGTGTHTITYDFTDGNNCSNACSYTITVAALPVVNCPSNTTVCIDAAPFALSGATPVGGTYSGPGVSAGTFNPATAGVGPHTITYSYTNANNCSNTCTYTITVAALPVVNCPSNTTVCIDAAPFALSGGAPMGGTYSGPGVSAGTFNPANAGVGTHTITYSYTNASNCSNTCTYTITVAALPVVNCPSNTTVCIDAAPFALSGGTPMGGTYSGPGVSAGTFNPANAGVGPHTITYAYTNASNCTNTCTYTITVAALPVLSCPGDMTVCIDAAPFALSGATPVGGTYSGPGVSAGTFNPANAGVGTHTITYSYTNANNCSKTCTFHISVTSTPVVNCPSNTTVCIDAAPFALSGGTPMGGTYSGPGVNAGMFNPATAGVGPHTITYAYTNGSNCMGSCTYMITVISVPVASCPPNMTVCVDASPFALSGGTPMGGTYSGPGVNAGTFSPAAAGLGMHTITYTYTGGNNCMSSCTFTIKVNSLPEVSCPANSAVCIDVTPFALTGGLPAGGVYSGAGVNAGVFNPSNAGVGPHTITYTYTALNNCSKSCTYTITVNGLPVVSCPSNMTVCADAAPFALSGATPMGGTYSGPGVSAGMFNPATAGAGTHTITYLYTNGNNCSASCTFTITVNALPMVSCPGNMMVCVDATPFALSGASPGGGTYSGTGVSGGVFNPAAAGLGAHTITYTYTSGNNNCTNSCTFTIEVSLALPVSIIYSPTYCMQDPGPVIGVSNSMVGVTYQLQDNGGTNLGSPQAGNGGTIYFGVHPNGTYKVVATGASCSNIATETVNAAASACAIVVPNYCVCDAPDGRASVTVQVTAPAGQNWTVKNVIGLYSLASPPAPNAPTPLLLGTSLNYTGPNTYTLDAIRLTTKGFWVQVTNGFTDLDVMVGNASW